MDAYTQWYERSILGCTLERWAENRSLDDVLAWVDENESHGKSAMGLFVRFTRGLGFEKLGRGSGNLLSYGVYFDPVAWQPPFGDQKTLRASGFYDAAAGQVKPFSQLEIAGASEALVVQRPWRRQGRPSIQRRDDTHLCARHRKVLLGEGPRATRARSSRSDACLSSTWLATR